MDAPDPRSAGHRCGNRDIRSSIKDPARDLGHLHPSEGAQTSKIAKRENHSRRCALLKAVYLFGSHDGEPLFRNLSLTLSHADRVGLVGPNGVGKSTLLPILAGVLRPDRSAVTRSRTLGYYAQQVPDPRATVKQCLANAPGELSRLFREIDKDLDRFTQLGGWDYAARVDAVRTRLGIDAINRTRPLA